MESSKKQGVALQAKNLVSLDVVCYNEDLEWVKTLQLVGSQPKVEVDLSDTHYFTLTFNSTADVATKYTEKELTTLITSMQPYVGVKLDFVKDSKIVRTNYSLYNLNIINVYKYDVLNVSLCSWPEMSKYFLKCHNDSFITDDEDDYDESSSEMSCSDVSRGSEEDERGYDTTD